jgi:hypothetical protein
VFPVWYELNFYIIYLGILGLQMVKMRRVLCNRRGKTSNVACRPIAT